MLEVEVVLNTIVLLMQEQVAQVAVVQVVLVLIMVMVLIMVVMEQTV
jgi:hypothetical protein